jgi:hypothetical protein
MKTSSQILAYIKGQTEAISGEMEDNRFMTSETRRGITARLEVLKDLQKWIEKPGARDSDVFNSSAMR